MEYPDYQKSAFLKLKEVLKNEGDSIRLKLVSAKMVDAKDTKFGCNKLEMIVLMNEDGKAVKKELSCDAPDEKNKFKGSTLYQGIKDNSLQPGDVFFVVHGGHMKNMYKTVIYNVNKEVANKEKFPVEQQKPVATPPVDDSQVPLDEEITIDDIPF